jgi:hypothetical protein
VDRICPYLALLEDGRTVSDGFDAEHRCLAVSPPATLERARQVQLCLTEAHVRCERFVSARQAWLAASSGLPRVAPDVAFGTTRLVLEPEPAWRSLASTPRERLGRRALLVAAAIAVIVAVLVLGSAFRLFGGAPAASPSPTPTVSPTPLASPTISAAPSSTAGSVTLAPTPTPAPTATPAPTRRTYVVQEGDTLNGIAQKFGTTVQAIKSANGLTSDTINIGQVLIIP